MPSLKQIAERTGTDKLGHGFIDLYEEFLPKQCRTLLEIGVERGKSSLMWDEYYGHEELELSLLDLFVNPEFVSARWCRNKGFVPYKGDQSDTNFLYTIKDTFQVCIDDGSHRADHMLISFKHLFANNTASGSMYVIEDLHTNSDEFYWGSVTRFEDTPYSMFDKYLQSGKISNPFFEPSEAEFFEGIIESVRLFDKIVFITRK